MKNVAEWSAEFDILWNNIMSNQAPGLNGYEKSVFLTRAQEAVVVGIYNGSVSLPFESTEQITDYLSPLVKQANGTLDESAGIPHIVSGSSVYKLPEDLLFRTYESCKINDSKCGEKEVNVVPVTQDEFWRTHRNPFKGQNNRRVLRLSFADTVMDTTNVNDLDFHQMYSELISDSEILSYTVRYVKRPDPIILEDFPAGYPDIDGENTVMTCKLHENLHQAILMEAVRMAKAVWASS